MFRYRGRRSEIGLAIRLTWQVYPFIASNLNDSWLNEKLARMPSILPHWFAFLLDPVFFLFYTPAFKK